MVSIAYLEYKEMVAKDLIFRGYGGVLEEMFGGLAESFVVTFMKALGLNLNWVKQRDFARTSAWIIRPLLAICQCSTHLPGMILTLEFMWVDISRGYGLTFETRRTFDNGFSIGAFYKNERLQGRLWRGKF